VRDRTVFVVHGRNTRARDAVFAFLRALGLQPLEWEQAASLTDKGAPSTLEVVEAGLRAGRCVLVLLTGDDVAHLHPSLGREAPARQARPNVLLEAGMALARGGSKRTILVRVGDLREVSDISGISYVQLSNDAASRQALAKRLESAGCRVAPGSDYLDPRTGGDFSLVTPDAPPTDTVPAPRVFGRSGGTDFLAYVENAMKRASRIVLVGTGLNVLHNEPLALDLFRRAGEGRCHLDVYLADPASADVEARLMEEEMGHTRPPVGDSGLRQRLQTLLRLRRDLGQFASIRIRLFTHYPSFAMLVVDDEYFLYPYALRTLGNHSPVFRFLRSDMEDAAVIRFLDEHLDRVARSSVDAEATLEFRAAVAAGRRVDTDHLIGLALYYVPRADSPLYQFGSRVLGYDVRSGETMPPQYAAAGDAAAYGFHLTICDVLYFDEPIAEIARNAIRYVLHRTPPFELQLLGVTAGLPDPTAVSLKVGDPTGALETLQHEMVDHVYRRAAASNYSVGRAKLLRPLPPDRTRLAMRRFGAPYVFSAMTPHFTLLSPCPEAEQDALAAQLQRDLDRCLHSRDIKVETLSLMTARPGGRSWAIAEEISLG
jgi:hypothetical protein